jgi:hypothetical protein
MIELDTTSETSGCSHQWLEKKFLAERDSSMRFFAKRTQLVRWFVIKSSFEYKFEYAEIFDFKGPSALWATAVNLVICCGPLRRIWLCAMGHCAN